MKTKSPLALLVAVALMQSCSVSESVHAEKSCLKKERKKENEFDGKRVLAPSYGFFVRKNDASGWGSDLPPLF